MRIFVMRVTKENFSLTEMALFCYARYPLIREDFFIIIILFRENPLHCKTKEDTYLHKLCYDDVGCKQT